MPLYPKKRKIVVTGIGPISAIGVGNESLWKNILRRKQGVSYEKFYIDRNHVESAYSYKIRGFDIKNYNIDEEILEEINAWKNGKEALDLSFFLCAIKLALTDSMLKLPCNKRVGLILAHEQPGSEQFYADLISKSFDLTRNNPAITKKKYFNALNSMLSRIAYDQQTFMFLFHVARAFKIHNFSLFVNNACASGLYAIETASQLIKNFTLDIVIVAAVDSPDLFRSLWLKENRLYSEDGTIRPFDSRRNGFVCGQGGAALVLEDFKSAKERNAKIYAEYAGGGFALESWKVTLPHIMQKFYGSAIKQSLINANLGPQDIDLINAHGVGTNIIDQYEANAIRQNFCGKYLSVPVNAFKPYIGHTLGASALLETAILLLSMEKNLIVPTLNVDELDPKLNINVITKFRKMVLKTVLKLSCGFGGFDGSAIFRKI